MNPIVQNMFEINYSRLIQYEILEKLVTFFRRNEVKKYFPKKCNEFLRGCGGGELKCVSRPVLAGKKLIFLNIKI